MNEHKNIGIDISENGYIISANGKTYIFDCIKKARTWIEENIAPTGDIKQFSDALDDENKKYGSVDATTNELLEQLFNSIDK